MAVALGGGVPLRDRDDTGLGGHTKTQWNNVFGDDKHQEGVK